MVDRMDDIGKAVEFVFFIWCFQRARHFRAFRYHQMRFYIVCAQKYQGLDAVLETAGSADADNQTSGHESLS